MSKGWFFLSFLVSTAVFGQTYYVTPQGNDANNGLRWETSWTPLKASNAVRPGDTIIVRKGNYKYDATNFFAPVSGGTASAPITIRGENRDDPPILSRG